MRQFVDETRGEVSFTGATGSMKNQQGVEAAVTDRAKRVGDFVNRRPGRAVFHHRKKSGERADWMHKAPEASSFHTKSYRE